MRSHADVRGATLASGHFYAADSDQSPGLLVVVGGVCDLEDEIANTAHDLIRVGHLRSFQSVGRRLQPESGLGRYQYGCAFGCIVKTCLFALSIKDV